MLISYFLNTQNLVAMYIIKNVKKFIFENNYVLFSVSD